VVTGSLQVYVSNTKMPGAGLCISMCFMKLQYEALPDCGPGQESASSCQVSCSISCIGAS